jgi:hypothetical protein
LASEHAAEGLALWLLNPLVLNESVGHGHNEVITATVILLGLWLLLRGQPKLGLTTLIVAGLVKVIAWIVVPVAVIWVVRRYGWRQGAVHLGVGGLVGAALVWLAYVPSGGLDVLVTEARNRGWWYTGTWVAVAYQALSELRGWTHEDLLRQVIGPVTLLFGLVALVVMVKVRELRIATWGVVLAYLLIAAHWFQPWYGVTLIALTALAVERRLTRYAIVFTGFMLWQAVMGPYVILQLPFPLPPGGGHALMAAVTLLVPQLLALGMAVSASRQAVLSPKN